MTALAKAMTTRQAAVIGEYMLIQHLTEPGSSQTAGRTTEHASDDRPGQAADVDRRDGIPHPPPPCLDRSG